MSKQTKKATSHEERLAEALRANLARRKDQQRARQTKAPDKSSSADEAED